MGKNKKTTTLKKLRDNIHSRVHLFLSRREHRSFRITRRRDYIVQTPLPSYMRFTISVHKILWTNKRLFISLALIYMVLSIVLVGMFSQETYNALGEELSSISSEYSVGGIGTIEGAWVLFSTIMTGGLSNQTAEVQQVYSVLLALLLWLATVWALRNIIAGNKIRARDALYNSGSPIISTFLIVLFGFLQLLPFTIMLLVFSAANSSGLLELPIAAALSWLTVGLSGLLTLYWLGATLMSLVVVSLPGMYPWAAIRAASDLVLGRRLVIMYRLIWLSICVAVVWVIVMLTCILLVNWLTSFWGWFANIPVVPVLLVGLTTGTMIYSAAYVYMLYRGIVDGLETE